MERISFVIVTRNRRPLLERAVSSVREHCPTDVEIVVVDNASEDDTWDWVSGQLDVVGVRSSVNRGPGPGRNLGIRATTGNVVFLLDDDAYLAEPVLAPGLRLLDGDAEIGGIAYPIWEDRLGRLLYGGRTGRTKVFAAGGAMFRKEALERAGLFDERIRWSEEFDLAVRIHAAGYRLEGLEGPSVRHCAVGPLACAPAWKLRDVAAGRLRCVIQRFRWRRSVVMAGRVLVSVGLSGIRSGVLNPVPLAVAETIRFLPEILRDRAVVPAAVEDYYFEPNSLEDEYSVPLWRKAAARFLGSG